MNISREAAPRFVVILAGGTGERFWPVSRQKTPKQLLTLWGDRSLLQQAVDRVLPLVPAENLLILTHAAQLAAVRRQLPELPRANLVAEPCGRDTCAAITLGAALVARHAPEAVMAVLPADHVIPNANAFRQVLADAFQVAAYGPRLVTIGIPPTEPATGYGYIQVGPPLPAPAGPVRLHTPFFAAKRFVEKPPLAQAAAFVQSGHYRWNAGMFLWSVSTLTGALERHQPELAAAGQRWRQAGSGRLTALLARDYPALPKISVDFALMEKAQNVVVAQGDFAWDDLGAWPALLRHLPADPAGNCVVGDCLHVDAARNLVFDARTRHRTLTALVGVHDTVVVLTDDAILVAARGHAQQIKQLVNQLAGHPRYQALR